MVAEKKGNQESEKLGSVGKGDNKGRNGSIGDLGGAINLDITGKRKRRRGLKKGTQEKEITRMRLREWGHLKG